MAENALARYGYGEPVQNALAQPTLGPGPAPTGYDKVFDSIYGWLGGTPDKRWAANKLADVATLGGLAPWAGAYDGGRELAETGRPANLAMALLPGARIAKPAVQAAEQGATRAVNALAPQPVPHTVVPPGIKAYHGSPHDFDKFSLDKIGTGEGAQAYGHGLYFAEREGVARSYRDTLAGSSKYHGVPLDREAIEGWSARTADERAAQKSLVKYLDDAGWDDAGNLEQVIKDVAQGHDGDLVSAYRSMAERAGYYNPGHMYEVRINAHPDDFLDWDKPLSQQSEKVRGALQKHFSSDPIRSRDLSGDVIPAYLMRNAHGPDTTSALRDAGIPGIRYLDGGSRSAGEGSHNYVAFDDRLVEILRKYGLVPPAAAGALAASNSDPAQAQQ